MSHHKRGSAELLATTGEIAEALRKLADHIEKDSLSFPQGELPVAFLKGLRIKVSPVGSGWLLEVRAKGGAARSREAEPQGAEREDLSFKQLKKQMKRSFKVLRTLATEGTLPPPELREAFREECRRMRELAPSADPAYEAFEAFAGSLCEAEDIESARAILGRMGEGERTCHKLYR